MAKLDDLIQQKQQRDEDWKAKKTAEREELGQLSDDAVMHVTSEPGAYLHYLDTQAINPRYSASNVMLAMAQNPEITYINSLESNLMQMVLVKEKINLFMKGQDTDLDEIYERFGIDYNLLSLLMRREKDEEGRFQIRWGEQKIA